MNAANIIMSTAIAIAGIAIAFAQLTIAQANFTHTAFERRYAIYAAARTLLSDVFRQANVMHEEILAFNRASADSVFVLDDGLTAYMKELRDKAIRLNYLRKIVETRHPVDQVDAAINESTELAIWFTNQFDVLIEKFKPFLRLKPSVFGWRA
jgi:hypothetical protein